MKRDTYKRAKTLYRTAGLIPPIGMAEKTIRIPGELYEKARRYIEENGGFQSVDELAAYLLEEFLAEDESQQLTREEEEKIRDRLRSLGYI